MIFGVTLSIYVRPLRSNVEKFWKAVSSIAHFSTKNKISGQFFKNFVKYFAEKAERAMPLRFHTSFVIPLWRVFPGGIHRNGK